MSDLDKAFEQFEAEEQTYAQISRNIQAEREMILKHWPNTCLSCDGWGMRAWVENASPHGSGEYWPMEVGDLCEVCLGQDRCPRCGANLHELPNCHNCDWNESCQGMPASF